MEKKIGDIFEAFENYRFEDALRQIDQLMKKIAKDNKKKNLLTQSDDRMIHIIKCGSLASVGKIHQANHLIETYFTQKIISQMPTEQVFLFCSIAELAYDNKIAQKVQLMSKRGKGDVRLQRFMLSRRMFSFVSKSFLKQFVTAKRHQDGLAQIFLEYINQVNKNHPIQGDYTRDLKILPNKELNLKMVQLFFMKYLTGVTLDKLQNVKLRSSIIDLKIRLAINGNKAEDARKLYLQHFQHIQQHFVYLRSIRNMPQDEQQNFRFYTQNCGRIFHRNIQIEKYVPLYDYYNEFLDFLLTEGITKDCKSVHLATQCPEQLSEEQMYNFKRIGNDQLLAHYLKSLSQQLKSLITGPKHQASKKSDYYKISIKGLILQLLKIHHQVSQRTLKSDQESYKQLSANKSFTSLLDEYFKQFSKTLTYVNEMKDYVPFLRENFQGILGFVTGQKENLRLPRNFQRQDDNLILLTNTLKVLAVSNKQKLSDWEEAQKWVHLCWKLYKRFIDAVQHQKRRQKGEIFLCDQFIIILNDILVYHIQNHPNVQTEEAQVFIESILTKLMAILDQATQISPFNGYLKMRLIYVCQKLNYFDKLIDTYLSLDIKSVQFQTLGYYLINPLNNFNLYTQFESVIVRMTRSYHENQRQTSEYCIKGLKSGTTNQVFEYFSYQKRLEKSFAKMMLFYTLYLKNQGGENSQFYLNWIQNKLNQYKQTNKKVSFNCDTKTMQNILQNLDSKTNFNSEVCRYNQYYGLFNSIQVFELQIKLRKIQTLIVQAVRQKSSQVNKSIQNYLEQVEKRYNKLKNVQHMSQLYNLEDQFDLIGQYLCKCQTQPKKQKLQYTLTLSALKAQMNFYLKLAQLKISVFKALKTGLELLKQTQKNQVLENQALLTNKVVIATISSLIRHFTQNMSWRQQTKKCWQLRQTLFTACNLFAAVEEDADKIKKLPKSTKSTISSFTKQLQQTVILSTTSIKFSENILSKKQILSIQIDRKYLEKTGERDQVLKRFACMDIKQAKKYLTK